MHHSKTEQGEPSIVSGCDAKSDRVVETMMPVVILSTADFNAPVWTNKQHLAVGLADCTSVIYIESLGLREPTLNLVDMKRALVKLGSLVFSRLGKRKRTSAVSDAPKNMTILTPRLLPFHRFSAIRWVNEKIVAKTILPKITNRGGFILWTFSPLTYGIEDQAARVVYHSVDLLHEIPGVPKNALVSAERRLISASDVVVASSVGVARHLKSLGADSPAVWENVASFELFSNARTERRARAIFAGNLTPTKVDVSLLRRIAEAGIPLALAGPLSIDGIDSNRDFQTLLDLPCVTYLGNLDLKSLATEVANSTVGLIPYHVNRYTDGVFPMKVYEYLAAGLEVISTPLPSISDKAIYGMRTLSSDHYTTGVVEAFNQFTEAGAELRRRSAEPFSWSNRIADAICLIDELSGRQVRNYGK